MEVTTIKGNKALAEALGVHANTVLTWRRKGVLQNATLADYGRTIIYDLNKVYECLHHQQAKAGRRARI